MINRIITNFGVQKTNFQRKGEKRNLSWISNQYFTPAILFMFKHKTFSYLDLKEFINKSTWDNNLRPILLAKKERGQTKIKNSLLTERKLKNKYRIFEFDSAAFSDELYSHFKTFMESDVKNNISLEFNLSLRRHIKEIDLERKKEFLEKKSGSAEKKEHILWNLNRDEILGWVKDLDEIKEIEKPTKKNMWHTIKRKPIPPNKKVLDLIQEIPSMNLNFDYKLLFLKEMKEIIYSNYKIQKLDDIFDIITRRLAKEDITIPIFKDVNRAKLARICRLYRTSLGDEVYN